MRCLLPFVLFTFCAHAQAQGIQCAYAYSSNGTAQPAAYAAPWDVLGSGTPKQNLATVDCTQAANTLTVGGAATQYVNKSAAVSLNGTSWTPITLTGTGAVGNWFPTTASLALNLGLTQLQGNWTYVQFLVATKQASGWAYGGCLVPQLQAAPQGCTPKWSIQGFYSPVTNAAVPASVSPLSTIASGSAVAQMTCTDTGSVPCSPVTWSMSGAPSFLAINAATGAITSNR